MNPTAAHEPAGQALAAMETGFDDLVLGRGLPTQVMDLITRAGEHRQHTELAQAWLEQAADLAPHHPAVWIALYRFHFYGHRLQQASEVAAQALQIAQAALSPAQRQAMASGRPCFCEDEARFDATVRFYLFTLKGLAYLDMRLGRLHSAGTRLHELRRLDPNDHIGAAVLAAVLARQQAGLTDEDSEPSLMAAAVPGRSVALPRGWGAVA